ncbi:MAG: hypothetical protein Q8P41_15835, partial [Pseudomonadota bacterium]|nr:hypothetical protein [Pseudomonadota bacterium]
MNDEIKAQRLATWLSSPAGTEPPEDLDPEVLGAVYALVPDRAPPPRVSIDDILGLVTTGPFASGTAAAARHEGGEAGGGASTAGAPTVPASTPGSIVEFPGMRIPAPKDTSDPPSELFETEVMPLGSDGPVRLVSHPGGRAPEVGGAPVATPVSRTTTSEAAATGSRANEPASRRAPSRMWMLPTIGLALAAAAATLVIVPNLGQLGEPDFAEQETLRELQAPAALAPPAPQGGAIAELTAAPAELDDEGTTEARKEAAAVGARPADAPAADGRAADGPAADG